MFLLLPLIPRSSLSHTSPEYFLIVATLQLLTQVLSSPNKIIIPLVLQI